VSHKHVQESLRSWITPYDPDAVVLIAQMEDGRFALMGTVHGRNIEPPPGPYLIGETSTDERIELEWMRACVEALATPQPPEEASPSEIAAQLREFADRVEDFSDE